VPVRLCRRGADRSPLLQNCSVVAETGPPPSFHTRRYDAGVEQAPSDGSDDHPYAASRAALIGAFVAVVVAGLSGAAIGFGLVGIGCTGDCGTVSGLGALLGGLVAAGGVAIVAVLLLRSMAEWKAGGIRRS
jgi:hypothetical protein